jgi:hypothetical protein
VTGFTGNMADLLRCCDLVVTKAGPGTIAEAACCGAPMLLTSHVPGQETGNTELVAQAAAGRGLRGVRRLVAEIGRLREDQGALDAMHAASARMSKPGAAADIAALIADLVQVEPTSAASPARPCRDNSSNAPAMRTAGRRRRRARASDRAPGAAERPAGAAARPAGAPGRTPS